MSNSRKVSKLEIDLTCKELATYLLGKILVRKLNNNVILKGMIVETECYLGGEDKASHSYGGRRTIANEPMYMESGTCYVYMTYGMYYCFNISSKEPGAAVLLRALEPLAGMEYMQKFRTAKRKSNNPNKKPFKENELCNGPSKLCMAFDIHKENCNKVHLCENDFLWLETELDNSEEIKIVVSKRIGIDSVAKEWSEKPLRFYVLNNMHVSKRDKKAETEIST